MFGSTQVMQVGVKDVKPEESTEDDKNWPMSMFRIAIREKQLGLAYSMLDEGYNLMQAMQDAMDE